MLIRMYMRRKSRLNLNPESTILREKRFLLYIPLILYWVYKISRKHCVFYHHLIIFTFILSFFLLLFRVIEANHGNIPVTFKQFQSVISRLESPRSCVPEVDQELFGSCVTPSSDTDDDVYGVPSYDTIVLDEEDHGVSEWIGGETEALRRLKVLEKEVSLAEFHTC